MTRKQKIKKILILVGLLLFFGAVISTNYLPDPDCFYNAQMALIMKKQLVLKDFPWLQFSVLKENFVDHHFLYHVLLIPFVSLSRWGISPLTGVALSAILLASLLMFIFYWLLTKWQIKYSLIYTGLLLLVLPFTFRIALARAPAVSNIFLLTGLYYIFQTAYNRHKKIIWPLFIISFFYVWLYAAWILLPVMLVIYLLGLILYRLSQEKIINWQARKIITQIKNVLAENLAKILTIASGAVTGLIINPYFPNNLKFYYHQIGQIALINFHNQFEVGSEWYPYASSDFFKELWLVLGCLIVTLAIFLFMRKEKINSVAKEKNWALLLMTTFFFIYTIKARRSVEYLAPLTLLLTATILNDFRCSNHWLIIKQKIKNLFAGWPLIFKVMISVFALWWAGFISLSVFELRASLKNFRTDYLAPASWWLKNNVPAGQIIYNVNWDDFGFLFYYNPQNYYINGLDQTFMYAYNPELFNLYKQIHNGLYFKNFKQVIKDKFNTRYLVMAKDKNIKLYRLLILLPKDFEKVHEDKEAVIFYIK